MQLVLGSTYAFGHTAHPPEVTFGQHNRRLTIIASFHQLCPLLHEVCFRHRSPLHLCLLQSAMIQTTGTAQQNTSCALSASVCTHCYCPESVGQQQNSELQKSLLLPLLSSHISVMYACCVCCLPSSPNEVSLWPSSSQGR